MKKTKTTTELIQEAPAKAPDGPVCPKCGLAKGWQGPTFRAAQTVDVTVPIRPYAFKTNRVQIAECLLYRCNSCGFTRHEPCSTVATGDKDATKTDSRVD